MKTVIVPTDFSENAGQAVRFALLLSGKWPLKLVFVHVSHVLVPTSAPTHVYEARLAEDLQQKQQQLATYIHELYRKLALTPGHNQLEFIVKEGFTIADLLIEVAREKKADLILMGTHGASGLWQKVVLGTNAASVIAKAPCAVLVIPPNYQYTGINKVAFASDLINAGEELLPVVEFARLFEAVVDVFHAYPVFPEKINIAAFDNDAFLSGLREKFDYEKINLYFVHTDTDNDIVGGIDIFVECYKPSLLVMYTYKRSFFDRIFNSSKTEEIAFRTQIPLLALQASLTA